MQDFTGMFEKVAAPYSLPKGALGATEGAIKSMIKNPNTPRMKLKELAAASSGRAAAIGAAYRKTRPSITQQTVHGSDLIMRSRLGPNAKRPSSPAEWATIGSSAPSLGAIATRKIFK